MGSLVFLSQAYLAIRLVVWLLLWICVAITTCCVCSYKGPPQILYRLFLICLTLQVLCDVFLMGYEDQPDFGLLGTWLFFSAVTSGFFVGLLTLLSSGYGVTRKVIRGLKLRLYGLSIFYFMTQVMRDFTVLELQGRAEFDNANTKRRNYDDLDAKSIVLIFFSYILNLLTLILVWVSIVDLSSREEASIQGMIKEVTAEDEAEAQQNGQHKTTTDKEDNQKEKLVRERVVSSDVQDPLDELESVPPIMGPNSKINVLGKAQLRRKLLVVRAYSRIGIFYCAMTIFVLLFNIIILNEKFGQFTIVSNNLFLWLIYLWFAIVLRPKSDVVQENNGGGQNGFSAELELGDIVSKTPQNMFKKRKDSLSPKFSLDDEEP